jgi:hypothetical protein
VEFGLGGCVLRALLPSRRDQVGEGEEEHGEGDRDHRAGTTRLIATPIKERRNDRGRDEGRPPIVGTLAAGVAQYARQSGEEDDHEAGRRRLLDVPPRDVDQSRHEDDSTADHAQEHTAEHSQTSQNR